MKISILKKTSLLFFLTMFIFGGTAMAQRIQSEMQPLKKNTIAKVNFTTLNVTDKVFTFDANGVRAGYSITWEFGDGRYGFGKTANYTYGQGGDYLVSMVIYHGKTPIGKVTRLVHVNP